jgi:hypothetical protein
MLYWSSNYGKLLVVDLNTLQQCYIFRLVETLRLFRTLLRVSRTVRRDVMSRWECCCTFSTAGQVRGIGCCSFYGQCTVLWTVHCNVDSVLYGGQRNVLWTVHYVVECLLKLSGSVSSFLKLATNCLVLWLRRRGAVPLLQTYAFMACTGTALHDSNSHCCWLSALWA